MLAQSEDHTSTSIVIFTVRKCSTAVGSRSQPKASEDQGG